MKKPSILVIDDEKKFAEAMSERLRVAGYESTPCFSAKEAWDLVEKEDYDVVIQDLVMPEIDGIASMKQIKILKPLTEVIVLSGQATLQTAIEAMRQGSFEYLEKPCKINMVISTIQDALQRKNNHEQRIQKAIEKVNLITQGV
ncbi:MAG: response regulator [Pseudomonadota bacterium]